MSPGWGRGPGAGHDPPRLHEYRMTLERPARILFACALVFSLFMAFSPHPPALFLDRFGDKVEHMTDFGPMAVLARIGFPPAPSFRILERLSFVGALIEVFQAMPALHRDCDWKDWAADTVAIPVALALTRRFRRYPAADSHQAAAGLGA